MAIVTLYASAEAIALSEKAYNTKRNQLLGLDDFEACLLSCEIATETPQIKKSLA